MYPCEVNRLRPGQVVAQAICDARGGVLLQAGTTLTAEYIAGLGRRGVSAVQVRDGVADEMPPVALISGALRTSVTNNVAQLFEGVSAMSRELFDGRPPGPRRADDIVAALGDRPLPLPDDGARAVTRLYEDVERLMAEILESASVASLESLKTHSTYVFEHSVDVAVIAIVLGRELDLPHAQLRELALGGLLHDLGMMYVDTEVLERPDALTQAEAEDVRKHPLLGFELLRRMPVFSILPAHIAYQHHERQDGRGYPRGLEGNNRIRRSVEERVDARLMLLAAEIAAVADAYSEATSARPQRPALPPDRALAAMRAQSGGGLNRAVVRALTRQLPPYPVGHWIEVTAGPHQGWRGVVSGLRRRAIDRPLLQLLVDPEGAPSPSGVELDLAEDEEAKVACIDGDGMPPTLEGRGVPVSAAP